MVWFYNGRHFYQTPLMILPPGDRIGIPGKPFSVEPPEKGLYFADQPAEARALWAAGAWCVFFRPDPRHKSPSESFPWLVR